MISSNFKNTLFNYQLRTFSINKYPFLKELNLSQKNLGCFNGNWFGNGPIFNSINPANNEIIASVQSGNIKDYSDIIEQMNYSKKSWNSIPAPKRGDIVRQIGDELRLKKSALGRLISLEMGKIESEGLGEVQEAIDICDYASGLSRMLNGKIIPSERPGHFMMERYNPLKGHLAVITAFNFPVAVAFWNIALSLVCGNTNLIKGADSTPLCSIALTNIISGVLKKNNVNPAVVSMIVGSGNTIGESILNDRNIEMVSFTGSTKVGKHVSEVVHNRFGRCLLELGGNNATIVMNDADQKMALRAVLFSAIGTAGQRCTSLRRLMVHADIYDEFLSKLLKAYHTIPIGDPLDPKTLCGPLHNKQAVANFVNAIDSIKKISSAKILCGGNKIDSVGNYVQPTIVEISSKESIVQVLIIFLFIFIYQNELFGPLLYVFKINSLDEAIEINNSVPQGLSSSLFTKDQSSIFKWTGENGSDCGIVNINIGPSGAEIGGAFGGDKETGGGRESGSDSWKQYMRRSTCTVNYSNSLPLAQGVSFDA